MSLARTADRASSPGIVSAPESTIVIGAVGPFEPGGARVPFTNRIDAGRRLARALARYDQEPVVVLALPRGGVPVAAEVAAALNAPLDLVLVRKIGYPPQPELAMGAVVDGADPIIVRNEDVIRVTGVSEAEFDAVCKQELAEIERRRARYLGARAPSSFRDARPSSSTTVWRRAPRCAPRSAPCANANLARSCSPSLSRPPTRSRACAATPMRSFAWRLTNSLARSGPYYADFSQVSDEEMISILASHSEPASTSAEKDRR